MVEAEVETVVRLGLWVWMDGGVEGAEVRCFDSLYRVAEGGGALFAQDFLPADIGGFAGFGLREGVGVVMFAFLSYR